MNAVLIVLPLLIIVIVLLDFFVHLIGHQSDKCDHIYRSHLNVGPSILTFDRRQYTDLAGSDVPAHL